MKIFIFLGLFFGISLQAKTVAETSYDFCSSNQSKSDISPLDKDSVCPNLHPKLSQASPDVQETLMKRVPPDHLVQCLEEVQVPYLNDQGQEAVGRMIVNSDIALELKCMFIDIKRIGYQVAKIKTANETEHFWQESNLMKANITWGYDYRKREGRPIRSFRSMGRAFVLNPVCNPYLPHAAGGLFDVVNKWPENGSTEGLFRNTCFLGGKAISHKENRVKANQVRALFRGNEIYHPKYLGWEWGGDWNDGKSYGRIQKRGIKHQAADPESHPGPHRTKGKHCIKTSVQRILDNPREVSFLRERSLVSIKNQYKTFCGRFKALEKNPASN